ncbi:MAG: N(G),N(G)-dimethylarginine dimethylaminohydrolase [Chloroflexi bacterium RBG_16_57_11]|nr:MAG: N(G),N(G)-dimethylarginine dimethylaminohydrolase [Chloroflexi bacterium RBG_16_57_11]
MPPTHPIFQSAIVRPPASNFADGLTTQSLGAPSFEKAMQQHTAYCQALQSCGLELTVLPADPDYPDSTFVEDTAVLTPRGAILARPGAMSREGEVHAMRPALGVFFDDLAEITPPGTLDGGDICEAGEHFFIGISERTNPDGARQLADYLRQLGYTSDFVDIRGVRGILHLKSGIAYLGDGQLALIEALADHPAFRRYEILHLEPEENYAANCVRINDYVLTAAGYPCFHQVLKKAGYQTLPLDMSEFQKMDGGLSCLSLRF